jgi:hypothetical protein
MTSYPQDDASLRGRAVEHEQIDDTVRRYNESAAAAGTPSIAQLLGEVVADAQALVRKEFELARAEVTGEIDKAKQGAISLGIGAGVAAVGALLLILALVHGLSALFDLPLWASYLIVGGILAVGGAIALMSGISRMKQIDPVPRETLESVRKDVETLTSSESTEVR